VDEYVARLRDELAGKKAAGLAKQGLAGQGFTGPVEEPGLQTIYVGGGTPTVLPARLLLPLVRDLATRLGEGGEFTIEANPGTIDAELLVGLREAGATRLSLGVQSFSAAGRADLGRRVTQAELESALEAIAASGWQEWSVDLVFGIPGQTWPQASSDIEQAISLGPTHISLYDLTYSAGYEKWVDRRLGAGARGAAGAIAEEYYAEATELLQEAGYRRYEVSNFALDGHECRHNLAYWRGEDYLGVGAAAVSTVGMERRTNPERVIDYLEGLPPRVELMDPNLRLWERAMLGLRTSEGVDEQSLEPVLDLEARDRLLAQGCLERRYGKLRLNAGFLDVSNTVIAALLTCPGSTRPSTPSRDDTHR
jgi:oxygen-independent coproporphyrinogen-3 oxidase